MHPRFRALLATLTESARASLPAPAPGSKALESKAAKLALLDCRDALTKFVADAAAELPAYVHA